MAQMSDGEGKKVMRGLSCSKCKTRIKNSSHFRNVFAESLHISNIRHLWPHKYNVILNSVNQAMLWWWNMKCCDFHHDIISIDIIRDKSILLLFSPIFFLEIIFSNLVCSIVCSKFHFCSKFTELRYS